MTRVADVLRGLTGGVFRSDVQVADFWTERNHGLLKHYIFTSQAPSGRKSSVELLRVFSEACAPGVMENRFVVIATYGHGKSHFALSLANYFGKPYASEESKTVLDAIRHAVPDHDRPLFGQLESFKKEHEPYLVLVLRGDEPSDLPTKFHRALKTALAQDPDEASDSQLPFWFKDAEEFLANLTPALRGQANDYLAKRSLDVDSLLSKVRDRQATTYEVCVELVQELHKVKPQFGAGLSLADAVDWVVANKCGPGKRYAGLLILFDEFSAFVGDYCYPMHRGTPLQDLLNGVASARERALFVAFAQHDPDEVARRSSSEGIRENVLKELERLPKVKRYQLHSSLEEVLESYLRKRDDLWLDLLKSGGSLHGSLDDATTKTLQAFRKRYTLLSGNSSDLSKRRCW